MTISFLDHLSFIFSWCYNFVFFQIILAFLPLRKNLLMRILAFFACNLLSTVPIYSNDLDNLLGVLLGFILYITVFHRGQWIEKATSILIFYPSLIAVNYFTQYIGMRSFFSITNLSGISSSEWTQEELLLSTSIHTLSLFLRLLFWLTTWLLFKKYLSQIVSNLTIKMWLILDALMLSPFVSIFTILYFMPEDPTITYPICAASIFSAFGCIYLASYICNSVQTAYHAQELEMKQTYYQEKVQSEERICRVYHDLKNHILILQAQAKDKQELQTSIEKLQSQIQEYENYYHTGNEFLDIIIRDKAKIAQKKQIDFSAVLSFQDSTFIDPLDISTIFGNALDNAIEASEKLPNDQRLITIKGNRIQDLLIIIIENHTIPVLSRQTTKTDSLLHGFGLSNIQKVVEQYEGQCHIKTEQDLFTLKILIPIPSL